MFEAKHPQPASAAQQEPVKEPVKLMSAQELSTAALLRLDYL
jgi:hypothetical protein